MRGCRRDDHSLGWRPHASLGATKYLRAVAGWFARDREWLLEGLTSGSFGMWKLLSPVSWVQSRHVEKLGAYSRGTSGISILYALYGYASIPEGTGTSLSVLKKNMAAVPRLNSGAVERHPRNATRHNTAQPPDIRSLSRMVMGLR
ncbi:hypothetical protein BST61_g2185 [Cercospora zeina]